MKCSRCNSTQSVKNGIVHDRQRRRCKNCGYNYTREGPRGKPPELRRMAVHLYLEGMGFRGIGRVLGVSNVTALQWVRQCAAVVAPLARAERPRQVAVMEMDEMWHYLQKNEQALGLACL